MKKRPAAVQLAPPVDAEPVLKLGVEADTIVLTEQQRRDLLRIAIQEQFPARRVVYPEGSTAEWVFVVADGAIKSYRELPSGKRAVSAFLFARDIFGLAEQGRYVNSAQAITDVALYRLPVRDLASLLKLDGDLQFKFLAKVTYELRESQRRAVIINRRDAPGRLAMFLVMMRRRARAMAASEWEVPLPMTRSDIAGFLGLSLETVSRAATLLERRGIVEFPPRRAARILDRARLARLAASV